ncbi:MAG: 16S rRNA (adenine(1518)-N(6)/adenine(1519)-N(6))-dimethyltransferase RsmA [Rubrivivax sp.]
MKHQARKRFGQHFLADPYVIEKLVEIIDPSPGQALVEIGPGLGALTWPLLRRCQALTVIELDRDLAAKLRAHAALAVVEADVLNVDFGQLLRPPGQLLRLVGNLPYNISTPILFHLLDASQHVADQHFMLQREVAHRMVATPGHKAYGRLSVMLQWRYHIETVLEVPPEAFDPPPKVHSTVVRMLPLPLAGARAAALLPELVSVAFSQRRKLLRHTLGRWLDSREVHTDFDLQRRAEEVPVAQYVDLAHHTERSQRSTQ